MKKFKKSWGFILLVLVAGIILLLLSYSDEKLIDSTKTKEILKVMGSTVLSSAVFLGVVKTLQYTDYFKSEINEVIFTDEYLKELDIKTLEKKWVMLTNVLHTTNFPSLKDNLNNHLLDGIISHVKNYTHSRMTITFDIKPVGTDKKYFRLVEKSEMHINGQKNEQIQFKVRTHIIKEKEDQGNPFIRYTQMLIDGADHLPDLPAPLQDETEDGLLMEQINFSFPIEKRQSVPVIKEFETIHSLKFNGFWRMEFETFVEDGLEIRLYYDKSIFEVDLLGIGQTIDLVQDQHEKHFVKFTCENLIFQKDCLVLIIKYH